MAAAPTIDINTLLNFVFMIVLLALVLQMVGKFLPKTP
jgi:hypothetical protein